MDAKKAIRERYAREKAARETAHALKTQANEKRDREGADEVPELAEKFTKLAKKYHRLRQDADPGGTEEGSVVRLPELSPEALSGFSKLWKWLRGRVAHSTTEVAVWFIIPSVTLMMEVETGIIWKVDFSPAYDMVRLSEEVLVQMTASNLDRLIHDLEVACTYIEVLRDLDLAAEGDSQ